MTLPMHGWRFQVPRGQSRNSFFTAPVGNRRVVAFLRYDPMAAPVLAEEPSVKLPAVNVYGIHAGTPEGVRIGYVFWSPLVTVVDPFFTLYHRPQYSPMDSVREGATGVNKYQLRGGIAVFVIEDDAVLLTYHTVSRITEALDA